MDARWVGGTSGVKPRPLERIGTNRPVGMMPGSARHDRRMEEMLVQLWIALSITANGMGRGVEEPQGGSGWNIERSTSNERRGDGATAGISRRVRQWKAMIHGSAMYRVSEEWGGMHWAAEQGEFALGGRDVKSQASTP